MECNLALHRDNVAQRPLPCPCRRAGLKKALATARSRTVIAFNWRKLRCRTGRFRTGRRPNGCTPAQDAVRSSNSGIASRVKSDRGGADHLSAESATTVNARIPSKSSLGKLIVPHITVVILCNDKSFSCPLQRHRHRLVNGPGVSTTPPGCTLR